MKCKIYNLFAKIILVTFLSFSSTSSFCQESILFKKKVSAFKFSDGNEVRSLHKFKHVFTDKPQDLKNFKKFNRARKTQRIVNYSYLGIVGITGIVDFSGDHGNCSGINLCEPGPITILWICT